MMITGNRWAYTLEMVRRTMPNVQQATSQRGGSKYEKRCFGSRWVCGRLRLGERLQDPEEGRFQRQRRTESDNFIGGRCRRYQANSCSAGRGVDFSLATPMA